MNSRQQQDAADAFETVRRIGLMFPDVTATTRYDGSPVLKLRNCFMAGLAGHRSAEPNTLVVRATLEERDLLIAEAPDTYYVTDHHRPYPVVLVRLATVDDDVLRELLGMSWRLTEPKTRRRRKNSGGRR